MAAMYASYHGADGLAGIARRVHERARTVAAGLSAAGIEVVHDRFFDTVLARVPGRAGQVRDEAKSRGINVWLVDDDHVSVSCDEATTPEHVDGGARGVRSRPRRHQQSAERLRRSGPTSPPGRPTS